MTDRLSNERPDENAAFDQHAFFEQYEREEFGPLDALEKEVNGARNAFCVQFDEMLRGRGGDTSEEASDLLLELAENHRTSLFQLFEYASEYLKPEEAVVYIEERLTHDHHTTLDLLLTSANFKSHDDALNFDDYEEMIDLDVMSDDTTSYIATEYVSAYHGNTGEDEDEESEEDDDDTNYDMIEQLEKLYKKIYENNLISFVEFIPENEAEKAATEAEFQRQAEEYERTRRREMIAQAALNAAASIIGTGIALGASKLFSKYRSK